MSDTQTIVRKIKLYPVGDKEEVNRVYKFIRDGQYAQYQALNLLMGQITSKYYECGRDFKCEEFKTFQKEKIVNSNPIFEGIEFAKGVDTLSAVTQTVKADFSTALKNGLARGERTITNYKRTYPLITRGRDCKFVYDYANYQEFLDNLFSSELKIYMKWVNRIKFEVILGNPHRSAELRSVFQNIFEENYKVCQSSIAVEDKEIIINLSLQIPKQQIKLDENTVVGVDLGMAIPAVCGLNNNVYIRKSIGEAEDFLRIRTELQAQRRRLQRSLKSTSGGHGRNKKLHALDKLKSREDNFVTTYSHYISKNVVDFAVQNRAKYINIEDLAGYKTNKFILRNWSFYKLQQYITYKAEKYGIEVRKINPAYTSQLCSCCGHWEEGQRIDQAHFKCKSCGLEIGADYNASRNIAKSKLFTDKDYEKMKLQDKIKQAKDYYGIKEEYTEFEKENKEN